MRNRWQIRKRRAIHNVKFPRFERSFATLQHFLMTCNQWFQRKRGTKGPKQQLPEQTDRQKDLRAWLDAVMATEGEKKNKGTLGRWQKAECNDYRPIRLLLSGF